MSKFFDKLRDGIARFMYGRNGADSLNGAILILYVAVVLIRAFIVSMTTSVLVYNFLNAFSFALVMVYLFRAFSRNLEKRQLENTHFLNWWNPKQAALRNWNARRKDKEHCYIKCGGCGTWLRVPKGKGKIEITCPKCHQREIHKT